VHRDNTPDEPGHGEPGRDLAAEVMRQICEHLPAPAAPHIRTATEILIDTGCRPEDVAALPLDCLTSGADGAPVLVYDDRVRNARAEKARLGKEARAKRPESK
jgi:hypothetical protein